MTCKIGCHVQWQINRESNYRTIERCPLSTPNTILKTPSDFVLVRQKWLSDLEMEEIQREMEEREYIEVDETNDVLGAETQIDQEQANVESNRGECIVEAREQIEQLVN